MRIRFICMTEVQIGCYWPNSVPLLWEHLVINNSQTPRGRENARCKETTQHKRKEMSDFKNSSTQLQKKAQTRFSVFLHYSLFSIISLSQHKFWVWVTILGRMSRHFLIFSCNIVKTSLMTEVQLKGHMHSLNAHKGPILRHPWPDLLKAN